MTSKYVGTYIFVLRVNAYKFDSHLRGLPFHSPGGGGSIFFLSE